MDIIAFLKASHAGKDVHAVDVSDGWDKHVGYYFWDGTNKVHKLQLIREMRLDIGMEPMDIREMCSLCDLAKVVVDGDAYKAV